MNIGDTIHVLISAVSPNLEQLDIVDRTPKAIRVRHRHSGQGCWLPISGLLPRKPGVPTYEDEFILASWLRDRLDRRQERVLQICD